MSPPAKRPPRFIARQMALGFGAVAIVAVVMGVMLLGIINDVSGLVAGMRHDETSIRQGVELATAVRDLSLHIAQTLIDTDDAHLGRYEERRDDVRKQIQALSARIPADERWRIQALGERTQRMHDLFMTSALPAAQRGDLDEVRRFHQSLEQVGGEAAQQADALARATASQMAHAHDLATDATRLGLIGGGICAVLIVALSVGFTLRLRAQVLQPLVALADAADRFGRGDFERRVGDVGRGELAALSEAFDRMADELAAREARLLKNERMAAIGQLAAGVAHELNNPIGIIRGYLKTMTPEGDLETLREELGILDEEAGHCQRIAEDLLSYARTDDLTIEDVDVARFIRDTADRFGDSPVGTGRTIDVDVETATLLIDGTRFRQVLLNLLTNAVQASPASGVVRLTGHADTTHYHLYVDDAGPGIAPDDRHRVFEPFFSKRRGGSGLGLAVCLGIVEAHRGTIEVLESDEGGARFHVAIPFASDRPESSS